MADDVILSNAVSIEPSATKDFRSIFCPLIYATF